MVQLELDPQYLYPDKAEEILLRRENLLRRVRGWNRWSNRRTFQEVSLEEALETLLDRSYHYFENNTKVVGNGVDVLVKSAMNKTLPFLLGKVGDFHHFGHFNHTMFGIILSSTAIDYYRRGKAKKLKSTDLPVKYEVKRMPEGFQPSLFGSERMRLVVNDHISSRLIEDLNDPDRVLEDDFSNKKSCKEVAQGLFLVGFSNSYVLWYLRSEGLGNFPASTVRVWHKRANGVGVLVESKVG